MKMPASLISKITTDPNICHGKPVIRGMRYPVENILELMAAGMSHEEILSDYPDLNREDLLACIEFAAKFATDSNRLPISSVLEGAVDFTL